MIDSSLATSFIKPETNCDQLSLRISLGRPTRENMQIKASATTSVSMDFSATASGYRVAKSTSVRIHRCPRSETGCNGPTKSMATFSNVKGLEIPYLEAQCVGIYRHDAHNLLQSAYIPGQWKFRIILSSVFFTPWWPDIIVSCATLST